MAGFNLDTACERIIFVSEDDTYRGPVSAALMKKRLPRGVPKVDSRGLVVLFNEPPNRKGASILADMGIDISRHKSRQLLESDFNDTTLVIMMTERGKKIIYDRFENAVNVYTLRELAGGEGDVEIPYGRTIDEYRESVLYIESLVDNLSEVIIRSAR